MALRGAGTAGEGGVRGDLGARGGFGGVGGPGGARSPLSLSLPPHSPHGSRAVFRGARGARRGRDVTAGAKWREKPALAGAAAMAPPVGNE